jgi:hypothetical protein
MDLYEPVLRICQKLFQGSGDCVNLKSSMIAIEQANNTGLEVRSLICLSECRSWRAGKDGDQD